MVTAPLAALQAPAKRVPIGYAPEPEYVRLRVTSPATDGDGFVTTVTNRDTKAITSLTWIAIVERQDQLDRPVAIVTSPIFNVRLEAGQSAVLTGSWLNTAHIDQLMIDLGSQRLQFYLTPGRVTYADGTEWTLKLDPTARHHADAMRFVNGQPRSFDIPRALVNAPRKAPADPRALCHDEHGASFSPGATLSVRGEPGRQARCEAGRWVEIR